MREIENLDSELDKKAMVLAERLSRLTSEVEVRVEEPLKAFKERYRQAEDTLCAAKGYGRRYGEPRRKAQERCRTLIARASNVRQNIQDLFDYLTSLTECTVDDPVEAARLPLCPKFQLRQYFQLAGEPWVFTAEVIGVLYVLVSALSILGSHLKAFKDEHAKRYGADSIVPVCVLDERRATVSEDGCRSEAEAKLREECLVQVLGPLHRMESFNSEIASIVKSANESYDKGATPEFMRRYLEEMQLFADRARQEAVLGVRERSDTLRESTLLKLGDSIFGELTARATSDLHRWTREAQLRNASDWSVLDREWTEHERNLKPQLANPNAEAKLQELISSEATRHSKALAMLEEDRTRMADGLREQADAFVQRLTAKFEVAIRLVDALPLRTHFSNLPGDEDIELPRMSIKRRLRRQQSGADVDHGDSLPGRQWEGLPLNELRRTLQGDGWPEDEKLAQTTPEMLEQLTSTIGSFRSPVHKKLFERRAFYYERFRGEFRNQVRQRNADLKVREEKEQRADRNWQAIVAQLSGETLDA